MAQRWIHCQAGGLHSTSHALKTNLKSLRFFYNTVRVHFKASSDKLTVTGASSNLIGRGRHTPLHVAAMKGSCEAAIALFKGCPHVDIEARSVRNETPLVTAAREGKLDFILCLMESYQDLAVPSQQWEIAASRAADNGHFNVVEFFIQQR